GRVGVAAWTAEPAEAEVAVSDEGAHPQLAGERERVTVVAVGVSGGVTLSCDVTEDPESPGFIWTLTALAGEGQGSPGERQSIVEAAGEKVCLAQIRQGEWAARRVADGLIGAQGVVYQRDTFGNLPRQRVRIAQECREVHLIVVKVPLARQRQSTLEQDSGGAELSPGHLKVGENPVGPRQAVRMIE